MSNRRPSPLRQFINVGDLKEESKQSEDIKLSDTTSHSDEKKETLKYETIRLPESTIEKLEDYLYHRQAKERWLTKQEIYNEAIVSFLADKEFEPMPEEARVRLNQMKQAKGRKKITA